jgi:hypothetical protein
MKKPFVNTLILFFTLIAAVKPYNANATHASGGEIVYEWISDSTYRFFFKFYRDCTGILEPQSQPLCFYNSCTNTTATYTMQKWSAPGNGSPIIPPCIGVTKCTNPSSLMPGYQEWIYYAIVVMPSQCSDWKIFTYVSDRNPSVNIQNATAQTFYVETHMNNVGSLQGNNSPYFATKPLPYLCVNQPTYFNNGAVDPDGDSLYTEMIMPQIVGLGCGNTPSNATFATTSPVYAIPNNPLQTNNTFVLQGATGGMTFVPTLLGPAAMAIRVKEYRNGIQIGSIIREMEAQVISCTAPPPTPTLTVKPSIQIVNGVAYGCPGLPLTFCFDAKSSNPNAKLKVYDNHMTVMPGSNIIYNGFLTDSVSGCFNWTPPANTFGNYTLNIMVVDTTCNGNLPTYTSFTIPVHIGKMPGITIAASPDTNVLSGTPVTFTATTTNCSSGTYQWQKNGVDVSGATAVTWTTSTIADMDIVTCKLHCNDSCASVTDTVSNPLTMHVFTSVKGVSAVRSATLYPNPNNGTFVLSGFATSKTNMQLEIVNAVGQSIWASQYTVNPGSFNQPVSVTNLSNGMYLLRIKTADGVEVKRMTINK